MTPAQVAVMAKYDQLSAELRDEIDAASEVEIAFMRRVVSNLFRLAEHAPDAVLAHATSMCGMTIAAAIAESHFRRNGTTEEVS